MRFKGNRQRNEYESTRKSPAFVWLFQCDKRQFVGLNISRQEYFINRLARGSNAVAFNESQLPPKLPVVSKRAFGLSVEAPIKASTGVVRLVEVWLSPSWP